MRAKLSKLMISILRSRSSKEQLRAALKDQSKTISHEGKEYSVRLGEQ